MEKIRTAIVGAGKMGSIHAKVYNQLEQSELVAIVDVQKDKADQLASLYNCDSCYDISDIIGKVDAVTISAPTVMHREFAEELIKNKISVLIEKPLATSASEGKKIVSLASAPSPCNKRTVSVSLPPPITATFLLSVRLLFTSTA